MTLNEFIQGFLGSDWLEITASFCGFICVYLVIKRKLANFFFGFIQVSLYAWIFYQHQLYSDMLLQFAYIFFQVYGFLHWRKNQDSAQALIVSNQSGRQLHIWIAVGLLMSATLGYMMATHTDADYAYPDAFTTIFSLTAQLLMTRRQLFNWSMWILVDIVAIYIYLQKGLYPTSMLYFCFLVMAVIGQITWYKTYQQQSHNS